MNSNIKKRTLEIYNKRKVEAKVKAEAKAKAEEMVNAEKARAEEKAQVEAARAEAKAKAEEKVKVEGAKAEEKARVEAARVEAARVEAARVEAARVEEKAKAHLPQKIDTSKKKDEHNIKLDIKDIDSPDTAEDSRTEPKSDDSFLEKKEEAGECIISNPPFFYIDYDRDNIQKAQNTGYKTLAVKKNDGLTGKDIERLTSGKLFDLKKMHLIINCWKVLTMSNLNTFSFDCTDCDPKAFERKMEDSIKWGNQPTLKDGLTKDGRRNFTPFRKGIADMLQSLYQRGVKIFILSNSDYTFVKFIFEYYKLDQYIEQFITPSTCGLPNGRDLNTKADFYRDRRKMNKARAFVCIERYIGRLCD